MPLNTITTKKVILKAIPKNKNNPEITELIRLQEATQSLTELVNFYKEKVSVLEAKLKEYSLFYTAENFLRSTRNYILFNS